MKTIIIKPTNKGLKEYAEKALKVFDRIENKEMIEARGEDIPFIVDQIKENVFGLTGEDLFKEYLLENKNSRIKILEKIEWYDKKAPFKKPTLCLLGPSDKDITSIPKKQKICINKKYKNIAEKYLAELESRVFIFEAAYCIVNNFFHH